MVMLHRVWYSSIIFLPSLYKKCCPGYFYPNKVQKEFLAIWGLKLALWKQRWWKDIRFKCWTFVWADEGGEKTKIEKYNWGIRV